MKQIAIIGLGLMGGSFALAVKRFSPKTKVVGIDRSKRAIQESLSRHAIDSGTTNLQAGVRHAELVILALPVGGILKLLGELRPLIQPETIVTDMGSTKAEICGEAKKRLPNHFVGGHPMTGSEVQGIKGADPFLFENALYLLTPLKIKDKNAQRLSAFLRKLGASPILIAPEAHDRITARVSHLPQVLAVALTQLVQSHSGKEPLHRELAAGGFRDMTRIAASAYGMWHDILETNAPKIRESIDEVIQILQSMKKNLGKSSVKNAFEKAGTFRRNLPMRGKGFMNRLHRIVVTVQDQKGTLAEITGAIAKEKINISDIELMKVREGVGGTFQLYFASGDEAMQAMKRLQSIGYETRMMD